MFVWWWLAISSSYIKPYQTTCQSIELSRPVSRCLVRWLTFRENSLRPLASFETRPHGSRLCQVPQILWPVGMLPMVHVYTLSWMYTEKTKNFFWHTQTVASQSTTSDISSTSFNKKRNQFRIAEDSNWFWKMTPRNMKKNMTVPASVLKHFTNMYLKLS